MPDKGAAPGDLTSVALREERTLSRQPCRREGDRRPGRRLGPEPGAWEERVLSHRPPFVQRHGLPARSADERQHRVLL